MNVCVRRQCERGCETDAALLRGDAHRADYRVSKPAYQP